MINQETINNILSIARIEEVISDYTSITKKGTTYEGCCPFHSEKTPSFKVSAVKGIYKCFGCGKAGNVVSFLMEHEKFTYPEALKHLAFKYNIPIEETVSTKENKITKTVLGAIETASNIFHRNIFSNEMLLSYLKKRKISDESIDKFKIGYAENSYSSITEQLKELDYNDFILEKSGLSILKNERFFDRFRDRLMFPIFNLSGNVIAFGGRRLNKDAKISKYVNSPESEIYSKSKVLYGLNFAKRSIVSKDLCYLTEGYIDVISMHQIGLENTVASSGTSLTKEQISLIARYTKNITILYDGDIAGIKASFRGIDMILEQGMNVNVLLFPDNNDPDSFIRKNEKDYVLSYIESNVVDFLTFKITFLNQNDSDATKESELINDIVLSLSKIPDVITRDFFIKKASLLLDIHKKFIYQKIDELILNKKSEKIVYKEIGKSSIEKELIKLILNHGEKIIHINARNDNNETIEVEIKLGLFVIIDIKTDELFFDDKLYQLIFDEYSKIMKSNMGLKENYFANHANKEISDVACSLITIDDITISENWGKISISPEVIAKKTLLMFKLNKIEEKININSIEIKSCVNEEAIVSLFQKREELLSLKKELSRLIKTN